VAKEKGQQIDGLSNPLPQKNALIFRFYDDTVQYSNRLFCQVKIESKIEIREEQMEHWSLLCLVFQRFGRRKP
jgi:hypothetical protein